MERETEYAALLAFVEPLWDVKLEISPSRRLGYPKRMALSDLKVWKSTKKFGIKNLILLDVIGLAEKRSTEMARCYARDTLRFPTDKK